MFRNDRRLGPASKPEGVLGGIKYPHGVSFAENGNTILVADAGAPVVHLYRNSGSDWTGEHQPHESIRVLSDETE